MLENTNPTLHYHMFSKTEKDKLSDKKLQEFNFRNFWFESAPPKSLYCKYTRANKDLKQMATQERRHKCGETWMSGELSFTARSIDKENGRKFDSQGS